MMHPEDDANTDAPLVPQIRPPNRRTTTTARETTDSTRSREATTADPETIRREISELRSRLDAIEADIDDRGED